MDDFFLHPCLKSVTRVNPERLCFTYQHVVVKGRCTKCDDPIVFIDPSHIEPELFMRMSYQEREG